MGYSRNLEDHQGTQEAYSPSRFLEFSIDTVTVLTIPNNLILSRKLTETWQNHIP